MRPSPGRTTGPTSLGSPGRDAVSFSAARTGRESPAPSRGRCTRAVPARGVRSLARDACVRVCAGWRHDHRPRVARASGADRVVRTVRRPADRSLRGEPRAPGRVPGAGCRDGRHGGLAACRCATCEHVRSRSRDGDGAVGDAPFTRRCVSRDRTHDGAARCPECGHGVDPEHRSGHRAGCRRPHSRRLRARCRLRSWRGVSLVAAVLVVPLRDLVPALAREVADTGRGTVGESRKAHGCLRARVRRGRS